MTNIYMIKSDNYIVAFRIQGHTDYAEYGSDIVCSAISFMSQTAILALNEVCKINEKSLHFKIDDGYLCFCLDFDLPKEVMDKSEIVMQTMITGFKSLIKEYPHNLTLNIEEVDL